jgi:hypothetical protein
MRFNITVGVTCSVLGVYAKTAATVITTATAAVAAAAADDDNNSVHLYESLPTV